MNLYELRLEGAAVLIRPGSGESMMAGRRLSEQLPKQ